MVQQIPKTYRITKSRHLAVMAFVLLLASCQQNSQNTQGAERQLSVEAFVVVPEVFAQRISTTGNLLAWEEVDIKTSVSGLVHTIHFREGQLVSKGELLLEMDSRSLRAQKRGLEARLLAAGSELERRQELVAIEGVSREEVERAQAEVSLLQAQIDELDVMIDLAHIRAPFAGRLGMRNISPGAYISQGETITRLVQNDQLKVEVSIPSKYAAMIKNGQEIEISASSTDSVAKATIYAIDPMIGQASRNLQLRARLDNRRQSYIPGDFVQVTLGVESTENALLIPAEAVIPELGNQVVYLVSNGLSEKRTITIGSRTRDRVRITSGLFPGDTVITSGLMEIREGIAVQVRSLNRESAQ